MFDVMPNASNTDRVRARDRRRRDDRTSRAVLAVQGPAALDRLATVFPEAAAVGRFRVGHGDVATACACTVAGTGYTGERGVEIAVPADAAADAVGRRSSAPASCRPGSAPATRCASRPALPLHGHELGPGITPLQAGLGWVVAWDKADVPRPRGAGRRARARASPATSSASPPRAGARRGPSCAVLVDGDAVGEVTSGNFSPVLGHGIALGVRAAGGRRRARRSTIDVRGTALPGTVVPTPFVAER